MSGSPVLVTSRAAFTPSNDTVRAALDALQAHIWVWCPETDAHHWSDGLRGLLGLDADTPAGIDSWLGSMHPDDQLRACDALVRASRQQQAFELCWRSHPAQANARTLMARGTPAPMSRQPNRMVITVLATPALPGTANMEARAEPRMAMRAALPHPTEDAPLLQAILDAMPGMVSYWSCELHLQFANQAYLNWLGRTWPEVQGAHVQTLLTPDQYRQCESHIQEALAGHAQHFERRSRRPSARHVQPQVMEVAYIPHTIGGEVCGLLTLATEVTEARRAAQAADAASAAKSDFLASISHEVRTPLNALFGLAQVGARQCEGHTIHRTFEQILDSAQHLLRLVNDMLDFSKIEAGRLTLLQERVSLAQVIDHVMSLHALQAQQKGLRLRLVESPRVPAHLEGDATRLSQILINLMSNAVRYTDLGEVCLRFDADGERLLIDVTDTGPGMNTAQLQKLFQPFVQVHNTSRHQHGGSGLGLAITQRLVNMMGGHVGISSTPGEGTHVSVILPIEKGEPADLSALGSVGLMHLEVEDREYLQDALSQRRVDVRELTTLTAHTPAPSVLVFGATGVSEAELQQLHRLQAHGATLLMHGTPIDHADWPQDLPVLRITGPLSPLRLAQALRRRSAPDLGQDQPRLAQMRILAAEDNAVNRLVLRQMLEHEGAVLTFACDGQQAIDQVSTQGGHSFDIVLCDIQMPIKDGYEVTRAIHELDPELPVIGLTAHAFASARQQAKSSGMVSYVTKPYLVDTLVAVLRQHARSVAPSIQEVAVSSPVPPHASLREAEALGNRAARLPASDFQEMKKHFVSQPLLLERLLSMLQRTLADIERDLDAALSQRRCDLLAKVAHNLKGTALNLHTPELTRLAIKTQEEARREDLECWASGSDLLASLRDFTAEMAQVQASA